MCVTMDTLFLSDDYAVPPTNPDSTELNVLTLGFSAGFTVLVCTLLAVS